MACKSKVPVEFRRNCKLYSMNRPGLRTPLALLAGLLGAVFSNNINIDDACNLPTTGTCYQCLSRNSEQIQTCQQLYFFITYSTGDSSNRNNEREISRYCNGECPIILATADYFCGADSPRLNTYLQKCPTYSELPSGSPQISKNVSSCLSSRGECLQCIGNDNREAVECLQLYLLAKNQNMSSAYISRYCEGNCPLILPSFTGYCGTPISDSFSICIQSSGQYCSAMRFQQSSRFNRATRSCSSNCRNAGCTAAITEFGCCLRQSLGDTCSNIPDDCNLPIDASTRDLSVPDTCSVSRCSSCLSRNTRDLQRCEQTYSYLAAAQNIQDTQSASVRKRFCSGECPILLITSDRFCNSNGRTSSLWRICPSYNRIPSASVDIRSSFGKRNCSLASSRKCEECILSNSPQPTRCLQLFLLTNHPNMSNFYLDEFCTGNCPLTLATSLWYCRDETIVEELFHMCQRNEAEHYCTALSSDINFNSAVTNCWSNCSSTSCVEGIRQYGCCINGGSSSELCRGQVTPCVIVTAAAFPPNIMRSSLLFVLLYSLFHSYLS